LSFRVCIPTAGTGSRLGEATRFLNKSLVAIANRPTLCHLIEQFPADTEFVIALGHKGHLVRQFLELAYPERSFLYAEVQPYEGPGSGLGLSLQACRAYLQQPFVFISCDTLVREPVPAPTHDWLAWADTPDLAPYRTLAVEGGVARALCEKGEGRSGSHHAYIGMAGIHDHSTFWKAMDTGGVDTGEARGLRALLAKAPGRTKAYRYTWFDTGHPAALEAARAAYREPDEPNILPKANEAIWFVGERVIKFCDDQKFIANRAQRAQQLADFVPSLLGVRDHMYSYRLVQGRVMSDAVDLPTFERFLAQCQAFWQPATLDPEAGHRFRQSCMTFYKDKTLERVSQYYRNFGTSDGSESLNGVASPTLASLLAEVDWEHLSNGRPGRFHGDFHFENIVVSPDGERFTFLDWRQDFGGSLSVGDVYYDLAKLLHGLIISHELITARHFHSSRSADAIRFDFHRKQVLVDCEHRFLAWVAEQGYEARRVQLLTALIYLNIAALHHDPYCHLLYALGKQMLLKLLRPGTAG
jgi:thiamine kinase-like enzyme